MNSVPVSFYFTVIFIFFDLIRLTNFVVLIIVLLIIFYKIFQNVRGFFFNCAAPKINV